MELKKYNEDGLGCDSCLYYPPELNVGYCMSCLKNFRKNYKNKSDIEWMNEQAEKKWRDNGGLVVCDKVDSSCESAHDLCVAYLPYKHNNIKMISEWRCPVNSCRVCKCVAYRGQDIKKEEPCEYVVVETFEIKNLAKSDIDPVIFKEMVRKFGKFHFCKDHQFIKTDGAFFINELERLGFIKKIVPDPVVKINDVFKRKDGKRFMIVSTGSGRAVLTGIEHNELYKSDKIFCIGDKLSDFVGDTTKDFKPCKIKITEVEEG